MAVEQSGGSSQSEYQALKQLIFDQFTAYEAGLVQANLPDPFLTEARLHPADDTSFLPNHELLHARRTLVGALGMMANLVASPAETLMIESLAHHRSAALSVVTESEVATALDEAGQALPLAELSKRVKVQEYTLVHALRLLINTCGIFSEPRSGVFANNRASLLLVKGSPVLAFARWQSWYSLGAAPYISKNWRASPKLGDSGTVFDAAAAEAWGFRGTGKDMWAWANENHPDRIVEFGQAMDVMNTVCAKAVTTRMTFANYPRSLQIGNSSLVADYPWDKLPAGATVVDVGGGQGNMLRAILNKHSQLRGVLQDRPEVVAPGRDAFERKAPHLIHANRIECEVYDFFTPQPRKGMDVYTMRFIIHDWPDKRCVEILKLQAAAMSRKSKLLIM